MIRLQCPNCERRLVLKPEFAGRMAICPGCQTQMRVPKLDNTEDEPVDVHEHEEKTEQESEKIAENPRRKRGARRAGRAGQPTAARRATRRQTAQMTAPAKEKEEKRCTSGAELSGVRHDHADRIGRVLVRLPVRSGGFHFAATDMDPGNNRHGLVAGRIYLCSDNCLPGRCYAGHALFLLRSLHALLRVRQF